MLRPTRYRARWLLPVTAPPIHDGALLVDRDGGIAAVGPEADVPAPDDVEHIDLGDAALLPGLVDVHAHPELAAFRGLLEDLPFHLWIPSLMRIKRAARPTAAEYGVAARWTCVEALEAGITTIGATEDSGVALGALLEAGMRGIVYREVFGPAPEQADAALAGLRDRVDAMRERETDRVRVGVSPHAPYTVSDALFTLVAEYALAEDLPVAVHAAEAEVEERLVRDGAGIFARGLNGRGIATPPRADSTIALLDRLGVLRARPLLIHCVRAGPDDIGRIADSGSAVAHCPAANARLGHGIAPVAEMLDADACVGLGTDSVASNNRLDLLEEARLAQMLQRARLGAPEILPPERLLRLATLDGARALGIDDRVGSLEVGKDADLCAVSLGGTSSVPVHDPLAALFHGARGTDVVLTAVAGRILFRAGRHLTLDVGELEPRLEAAARRLGEARAHAADFVGAGGPVNATDDG